VERALEGASDSLMRRSSSQMKSVMGLVSPPGLVKLKQPNSLNGSLTVDFEFGDYLR
jgi:hypothetical protein